MTRGRFGILHRYDIPGDQTYVGAPCHTTIAARESIRVQGFFAVSAVLSQPSQVLTMQTESQGHGGREGTISALNAAIEGVNLAKELSSISPAKAVFGSVGIILATIRVNQLLLR